MPVLNGTEERGDLTKLLIGLHLFDAGLRQALRIGLIIAVGAIENHRPMPCNALPLDLAPSQIVLSEGQLVGPRFGAVVAENAHVNTDIRVPASRQATKSRYATATRQCILKPAADANEVS